MIQSSQMPSFDMSLLLPAFHEISLPSAGLFDPNVPKQLHVRGLTVKELKHITANGRLDKRIFDSTIKACIKEPVDISRFLIEDYNYIIYMIRLFSSGSKVSAGTRCSNNACNQQFNFDYDISNCAIVNYAEQTIERTKTIDLPRFAEQGFNVQVEVKRLTRNDVLTVEKSIKQSMDMAAKSGIPNSVFPLVEYLKSYVVSISGFPFDMPKEQFLDVLSSDDASLLTSAFPDSFGITGQATPVCPICGTENIYDIPFTDIFFL